MPKRSLLFTAGLLVCASLACNGDRVRPAPRAAPVAPTVAPAAAIKVTRSPTPAPPPATVVAPPVAGSVVVVPGQAVGPIRLGMTEADVIAAGVPLAPPPWSPSSDTTRVGGAYLVQLDAGGRVTMARVELKDSGGVTVAGTSIPADADWDRAAAAFAGCGETVFTEGSTYIPCTGGTTVVMRGGLQPFVSVEVRTQPLT
ncbi:MAG: hypothetical protein R3B06_15050 [Kofleriaceae bacterium]